MRPILTRAAIDHILSVWAEVSPAAARELAPGYGITKSYVRKLASRHSVKAKRITPKRPKKPKRGPDPRWKWAIERGSVVA